MNSITANEFTVKDTFCFANETVEQDSFFAMRSFDNNLLFTNISPNEIIDICINTFYSQQDVIEGINRKRISKSFIISYKGILFYI